MAGGTINGLLPNVIHLHSSYFLSEKRQQLRSKFAAGNIGKENIQHFDVGSMDHYS